MTASAGTDRTRLLAELERAVGERDRAQALLAALAVPHRTAVECGNRGCASKQWPGLHCLECDDPVPCASVLAVAAAGGTPDPHLVAQAAWALLDVPYRWEELTSSFRAHLVSAATSALADDLEPAR